MDDWTGDHLAFEPHGAASGMLKMSSNILRT
jgi:hypothetical protein